MHGVVGVIGADMCVKDDSHGWMLAEIIHVPFGRVGYVAAVGFAERWKTNVE